MNGFKRITQWLCEHNFHKYYVSGIIPCQKDKWIIKRWCRRCNKVSYRYVSKGNK